MKTFKHPLIKDLEEREYQIRMAKTALKKNTLVCLPTGLGKTNIAVLVAAELLKQFPGSSIMVLSPTKPLVSQHFHSFQKFLKLPPESFQIITGATDPHERGKLYSKKIIVATPQTIQKDLENERFSIENFSLLVIDELHHAVGKYAYPYIARRFLDKAIHPRVLGLTASPGSSKEKISRICKNTGIEAVEIGTEDEEDIAPYVKKLESEWLDVELPESFLKIKALLDYSYRQRLEKLKRLGLSKPLSIVSKKDLLDFQIRLQGKIKKGNKASFWGASLVAQAIKIEHAISLLETQGIGVMRSYFNKLRKDSSKAAKTILADTRVSNAVFLTEKLFEQGSRHPKMGLLCSLVERQFKEKPNSKIIIFANYRETVKEINSILSNIRGAHPLVLIGQREGITQKEQIDIIRRYNEDSNCLVTTSIGEEGLSLEAADLAVFYEPVPSEIRQIQRRGRVGRTKVGKVMVLVTKGTRDEAYKWSAYHKEKKMRKTLYSMKKSGFI